MSWKKKDNELNKKDAEIKEKTYALKEKDWQLCIMHEKHDGMCQLYTEKVNKSKKARHDLEPRLEKYDNLVNALQETHLNLSDLPATDMVQLLKNTLFD